jgi:hypothetical protein
MRSFILNDKYSVVTDRSEKKSALHLPEKLQPLPQRKTDISPGLREAGDYLLRFSPRVRGISEIMKQFHGPEGIEPAMERRFQALRSPMLL